MSAKAKYCHRCGETLPETEDPFCKLCSASLITLDTGIECAGCQNLTQDTGLYCPHFTSSDA